MSKNMTISSPLRYPGSKKKLVAYLHEILRFNEIGPNVLIEPFVGGGSVALYFLLNNIVDKIIIADKDKLIYSFWKVLFSDPDHLINFIKKVKIDLNNFYKYKEIANNTRRHNANKLAETCLFLNRTSFSGMLTNGAGPIGGKKQESEYKIDCRFNKEMLINKIKPLSLFGKRVIVLPYDWKGTMKYAEEWLERKKGLNKLLFYFDPPFYYKADQLYRCYFNEKDHKDLCEEIISLKHDWLLSYDNTPEIKKMYSKFRKKNMHIQVPYSINSHAVRIEKEIIITPLKLPKISFS